MKNIAGYNGEVFLKEETNFIHPVDRIADHGPTPQIWVKNNNFNLMCG